MTSRVRRALSSLMAATIMSIIPYNAHEPIACAVEVRLPPKEEEPQGLAIWQMGEVPSIPGKTALVSKPKPHAQLADGLTLSVTQRVLGDLRPLRDKIGQGMLPFAMEAVKLIRGPRAP